MPCFSRVFATGLLLGFIARPARGADPAAEVMAAFQNLRDAPNYSWEATFGQLRAGPPDRTGRASSLKLIARPDFVNATGEADRNGFAVLKLHSSLQKLGAPQLAASRDVRHAIAETPDGWLTVEEISRALRATPAKQMVELNGRTVPKREALSEAGRAVMLKRPDDELAVLITDIETFGYEGDYIFGELSEAGRRRRSGRLPPTDERVLVFFRIVRGTIQEYLVGASRDTPNAAGGLNFSGSLVRISKIGRTIVVLPPGAQEKLPP